VNILQLEGGDVDIDTDGKALVNFHGNVKGDVNIHYHDEDHHYYTDEDGADDDSYFSELDEPLDAASEGEDPDDGIT